MRVNTNIASVNTLRQLGKTSASLGKAFGRLSSGFRINKAGDDAAGLGIANKLSADIRSLQQASRNAEQGTSLLQVAEGAAQVIQGMLERMKELATQSASDNTTGDGRAKIHAEFVDLRNEIDRVVDTTKFQGQTLLNGSLGNTVDAATSTTDDAAGVYGVTISGTSSGSYAVTATVGGAVTVANGGLTQTLTAVDGAQTLNFSLFGIEIETDSAFAIAAQTLDSTAVAVTGTGVNFMVSSSGDYTGQDLISLGSLDLRVSTLAINANSLSDAGDARTALTAIDGAISTVSTVFGTIGSTQNRMEFSKHNVDTAVENFMAAESVIRDADMAYEVSQMTKYQILQQAGTAVLAQANAAPQSILALLG